MGSSEDENGSSDVKGRLTAAWEGHSTAEACGILVNEVMARCITWLLNRFGHQGISYEDAEDCFNEGVEGILKRQPGQIADPYNYVFTSANNAALDILQERKHLVRYDPDWEGNEDDAPKSDGDGAQQPRPSWSEEALQIVAEAALDDEVTARGDYLRNIFDVTLPKLAPARRLLVEVLLDHGANISNAVLAELMNRSETAVKSLKSRTLDDLRSFLPVAAQELGINFDQLLAPTAEAWVRKPVLPSPEEDNELLP